MAEMDRNLTTVTLVEQYVPGVTEQQVRTALDLVGSSGTAPIVTILVSEEETVFSLYPAGVTPVPVVPPAGRPLEFARVVSGLARWSGRDEPAS